MTTNEAATLIENEVREQGIGFTIEGYEYATARLRELTTLKGLALKTVAGHVNHAAGH